MEAALGFSSDQMICSSLAPSIKMNIGGSLPRGSSIPESLCNPKAKSNWDDDVSSDHSLKSEVINPSGDVASSRLCDENCSLGPYRLQLEQDVQRLQQQLREEMDLRGVLENAVDNAPGTLVGLSCLPNDAQDLLASIANLDVAISRLEEQMVSLHYQLSQERNERKLAEYHLEQSQSQLSSLSVSSDLRTQPASSLRPLKLSVTQKLDASDEANCKCFSKKENCEEQLDCSSRISSQASCTCVKEESSLDCDEVGLDRKSSGGFSQSMELGKLNKEIVMKGIWSHPNVLSEEMVCCMKNIFISLAESSTTSSKSSSSEWPLSPVSPHGLLSSLSIWSLNEPSMAGPQLQSPQIDLKLNSDVLASEYVFDPYRFRGKLSWADTGIYSSAVEVSWMSVGKKQLEFAAGALRRFRLLVEQLAKVNPIHLRSDEKLAFWINLYNALIMHAYLAYGVPRSDLKLFSLMQKAAYTVGGHSFSAAAIEYAILKMNPPLHRPQTALLLALHKLKMTEDQRKFAIDTFEPLVTFALSSGMYSSPAVRIYTPGNVREELQDAQRDFIRASVGVSRKGKLLVPKLLHCFARGFTDDVNLAGWISRFLPPQQAAFVEQCTSQRRQRFLASRSCGILPFDSHFRYLFLP